VEQVCAYIHSTLSLFPTTFFSSMNSLFTVTLLALTTLIPAQDVSKLKLDRNRSNYNELVKLCKVVGEPPFITHFGLDKENSCADTLERGDPFSLALFNFCCPPHWCTNEKLRTQICTEA
ncbi:hypothetical protein PFISCL1PPCAC_3871, partial [Pristionchus fissidentatus]